MRCGKNETKSAYRAGSYSRASLRYASTRKAIWVNVKKEMPIGSSTSGFGKDEPVAQLNDSTRKLAYLKYPSTRRSPPTPNAISIEFCLTSNKRPTTKLKPIEDSISGR